MRVSIIAALLLAGGTALGQVPDVMIKLDIRPTLGSERQGPRTLRWYDSMGRPSLLGLSFTLEPGFTAYVAERLQRIPNDGDPEQLEAYYVEDPGIWRIGKQPLPFGSGKLMHESAMAARGDTGLFIEGLELSAALCDNGAGRPSGVVARLGGTVGISAAVGKHFGISSSALTPIRLPSQAPGFGRGYRLIVGADASRRFGKWLLQAEAVMLRDGHTSTDVATEATDLALTYKPLKDTMFSVAWSRDWGAATDFFRVESSFHLERGFWLETIARFKGGRIDDFGIGLRFKM